MSKNITGILFPFQVAQAYGGGAGVDMSKFPDLKFVDPVVDDVPLK